MEQKEAIIDLRSDTVTRPTAEMRQAMASAEVGDDVYREDPTVKRLEERAAEIIGKEAALFVPTGTMGNQTAIKVHTEPGQEVICDDRAHLAGYEMGMMGAFSGCQPRTVRTEDGILSWDLIEERLRPGIYYYSRNALVTLENTHNMGGGTVYPQEVVGDICRKAHERGLRVHLDGARIFNAAAFLGRPASELAAPCDSVMFCLSKGLGAPVGSVLAGSRTFIDKALRVRKMLGGGMRQAGVLAAAGLIALEKHPPKLAEDHRNASRLAEKLAGLPGIRVNLAKVQTNIVMFDVGETGISTTDFSSRLKARGILINSVDSRRLRAVTHSDVSRSDCERAMEVIASVVPVPA